MAGKIRIDQLADAVMKGMEQYAGLAAEDLKRDVQAAGKAVREEIQRTAPVRSGRYRKSWSVKKVSESSDAIHVVVHSRDAYQLTHLLEFGHAKRNGGRTRAFPHIKPAEELGIRKLEEDIRRDLESH